MKWNPDYQDANVEDLKGKTIVEMELHRDVGERDDYIKFKTDDGETYIMQHDQDCCETVYIESIEGELIDLLDTPLLVAEERSTTNEDKGEWGEDSKTWTFYEFATVKGSVNIRWLGESNGYYSEKVDFYRVVKREVA